MIGQNSPLVFLVSVPSIASCCFLIFTNKIWQKEANREMVEEFPKRNLRGEWDLQMGSPEIQHYPSTHLSVSSICAGEPLIQRLKI